MTTLVMKFGGTSTGNVEALNRAADLVVAQTGEWDRIVVVVSAMEGITDLLIECAERARCKDKGSFYTLIDRLHDKLSTVVRTEFTGEQYCEQLMSLIDTRIEELTSICQHIQLQGKVSPQEMAEVAAVGERLNIHVFSAVLRKRGLVCQPVDAAQCIVTDDCYQAASPIKKLTDARLEASLSPLLAKSIIPVVTGFIGATPHGATTTLGRGGSDYTAAILAQSLNADEIWIWTDVDGIMTVDPNLSSRSRLIPEISYNEVYQLAYSGAKVLHPKTILLAREGDIPIWVRNTFNPGVNGTRISHCSLSDRHTISAVTALFDINLITFRAKPGGDVNKIKGLISAVLKNQGTTTLGVFQAKHDRSVSFAISANHSNHAIQTIREDGALRSLGRNFSQPQEIESVALITLVGREIYLTPHALSSATNALNKAEVDIKRIGNGTSPDSLVFAVANQDGEHAINQIHDDVILNGTLNSPKTQPSLSHMSVI